MEYHINHAGMAEVHHAGGGHERLAEAEDRFPAGDSGPPLESDNMVRLHIMMFPAPESEWPDRVTDQYPGDGIGFEDFEDVLDRAARPRRSSDNQVAPAHLPCRNKVRAERENTLPGGRLTGYRFEDEVRHSSHDVQGGL